jgi:hypothetical protein
MTASQPPSKFGVVPVATAMQTDGLTFLRNMISQNYPAPDKSQLLAFGTSRWCRS